MVNIPPINPITSGAAPPAPQGANVVALITSITNVPDKIQQLGNQIQVNATVDQVLGSGTINLTSPLGTLSILIPQLSDLEQQKLIQQFINLTQTQSPVTVVVQPGNPPTQAIILLPMASSAAASSNLQSATQASGTPIPANVVIDTTAVKAQVVTGTILTAVVLPSSNISTPTTSLPQQSPQLTNTVGSPTSENTSLATGNLAGQALITGNSALPSASLANALPIANTLFTGDTSLASTLVPTANVAAPATPNLIPEIPNALIYQSLATEAEIENDQFLNLNLAPPLNPEAIREVTSVYPSDATTEHNLAPQTSFSTTSNAPLASEVFSSSLSGAGGGTLPSLSSATEAAFQPLSLFQTGNEVTLQVNSVIPPQVGTLTSASNLSSNLSSTVFSQYVSTLGPNQVVATVTAQGPSGQLILKVGDTALYVNQSLDAPVGTNLLVTLSQGKGGILTPLSTPDSGSLQNIQQTLSSLAQVNPQLAQAVLDGRIPQPTSALPGALLFFLSAVKQGDIRTWLGSDAMDALSRAGKFELLAKLTEDLTSSGQIARDSIVGEWRSYPVPLFNNNQFQIINFYVHGDAERQGGQEQRGSNSKKQHTRFLIDVRLSQLGAIQLDGFIQSKKLDMMVRSEHALPVGLHNELRAIYLNALSAADYAGSINFQVGRQHWMLVQKSAKGGAVVT